MPFSQLFRMFILVVSIFVMAAEAREECPDTALATTFMQKGVATGYFLDLYNEDPNGIARIETNRVSFWRSPENIPSVFGNCLSNYSMRMNLEYSTYREVDGEWLKCDRKDIVQGEINFWPENETSFASVTERYGCSDMSAEEIDTFKTCQQKNCRPQEDVKTYPDFNDNCTCKVFDDLIKTQDVQADYVDFYSRDDVVGRPSKVISWEGIKRMYLRVMSAHQ